MQYVTDADLIDVSSLYPPPVQLARDLECLIVALYQSRIFKYGA
jgi:hypothetical protein